jgi:DDE superfamily endonuclease
VKSYLARKQIGTIEWPPHSPELNGIEKVWSILKRMVAAEGPTTAAELSAACYKCWAEIPQQTLDNIAQSYEKALRAALDWIVALGGVIEANGFKSGANFPMTVFVYLYYGQIFLILSVL